MEKEDRKKEKFILDNDLVCDDYFIEEDTKKQINEDDEESVDRYGKKVEFIFKQLNNIKEYTDYYILPIGNKIKPDHIEQFLDHLYIKNRLNNFT